ncbi:MAG: YbbR-like domain-containing protein [Tannerellaceae bacterium]|jgi:hypothetical protein|nr:YbbR-like domain-containing protein [Tannerellaceae bacterium]
MMRLENIRNTFKSVHRKIKVFFSRFQWRETLIFLFFLLLSFAFWVLQSMQGEYEIQLEIPVTYKDIPQDMAFVRTPPSVITARIRDKGSVLLNYTLGQKKASIALHMQDTSAPDTLLLSMKDIEGIIMKQLIPSTNLISFDPQQIEIPYSRLKKKKVPVRFDGLIHTDPGFLLSGEIRITPSVTEVFAADVVLDALTSVQTVYTEIKGNKTLTRKLKLRKTEGANFDPGEVSVTIPIEEYTEKTLEIPVVCRGVPQGYTIRMFPSVVKLTCNVPLSLFKDLSEEDFSVEVLLDNPEQNVSGMMPIRLAKKPDWVDRAALSQDSIEFILELNR